MRIAGLDGAPESGKAKFADLASRKIPTSEDEINEFKEFYEYGSWAEKLDGLNDNERRAAEKKGRAASRKSVAKAVCAMGNKRGGFVYLGVRANGTPVGLEKDMILLRCP